MIFIGSKYASCERVGVKETAEYINENEHTVGKILQKLVKDDIINSVKGPNGGFYIDEKQKEFSVIRIIESIDGYQVFEQCGLGLSQCSEMRPCPFHNDFKPIREKFRIMCEKNKVKDLYENVNSGFAYLMG